MAQWTSNPRTDRTDRTGTGAPVSEGILGEIYDAGLPLTDIDIVIPEKTPVQSGDQRPSSESASPKPRLPVQVGKAEKSFTWHDAVGRLAITIAEKMEEDRITSARSVGYRDECVRAIERNYPGDITKREMSSFKGKEGVAKLEAFRKKMFPPRYSRSRYNGMMQNLRAVFEEAVAEGVLEANPCDHPKFKFVTLIVPPKKLKSVLLTDDEYKQLFQEIKETNGEHTYEAVRFLSLCGSRIDCARKMLKTDVNLDEDSFTFRREIIKGGKKPTGKDVVFPLYPELRDCVKKLRTFDHRSAGKKFSAKSVCECSAIFTHLLGRLD